MTFIPGKLVLSNPLTCTNTPKGENKLYSDAKGVVPSLDLRFAEGKNLNDYMTGTPLVDHQRSMSGSNLSPGTFVNSSGLIETAKVNLVVYSEDFSVSSAWVPVGSTAVQSTTVLAPDNLSFTYKLEEDNTTGAHRFLSGTSNTVSATINLPYTISFFVKNAGRDYVFIRFNTGVGDFVTGSVRLSDATVTQTITGTITATPVGNGWVRIVGTGVSNATGLAYPEIRASNSAIYSNYTGDGTSGIYVWGAQVEEGTTATTYIPTTNVPSAAPRFDHDPTTGESLGLLIEESRTNILLNSATLSTQSVTTSATAYTLSFYGTGTVTLSGTSTAGPLVGTGANDRVTLTFTPTAGTLTLTVTGTVSNAQLEQGSFPTSYIPTTGTALTRSADVASITGSNFSRWFVQNNGSFYCKADLQSPASSGQAPIFSVDNSGANSRIASRRSNLGVRNNSSSDGIDITNFSAWNGEVKEFALTWVANDCALVDSGTLIGTDTTTVNPLSTVNQLLIGDTNSGGFLTKMGGHISRLTYFPERLPDSSLQTMTTP